MRADTTATQGEGGTGDLNWSRRYCGHHQANIMVSITGHEEVGKSPYLR